MYKAKSLPKSEGEKWWNFEERKGVAEHETYYIKELSRIVSVMECHFGMCGHKYKMSHHGCLM